MAERPDELTGTAPPPGDRPAGERDLRVLIADDQTVVREGIVMVLGLLPGIEVVGSAADGQEAVRLTAERTPDAVLMDLRMPRMDGVAATRAIRSAHPHVQVVALTTYTDDDSVFPALRAGARGYLTKDADGDEIARTLREVCSGSAGLAPTVQRLLLERLTETPEDEPSAGGPAVGEQRHTTQEPPDSTTPPGPGEELRGPLTGRESEVLRLVADGLSNAEIARRLVVSMATVKTHINNLFTKLDVRDRAQAVAYAHRNGLTS